MTAKFSQAISLIYRTIKARIRKKLFIFLFFLFISTLFWFLNALSRDYTTIIYYPVEFTGFPKNKHLIKNKNLPDKLQLTVSAFGFSLLRYNMSSVPLPIVLNLKSLNLNRVRGNDTLKYFLLTNTLKGEIANQISSDFRITSVQPDSLIFTFSRMVSKKVPIRPNPHYTIAKQYMQINNPVVYPDSIWVSGSSYVLDTLKFVETKPISFTAMNQTFYGFFPLQKIPDVFLGTEKTLLQIQIERYTEGQIKIPISIKNIPQNMKMQIFPAYISVRYHIAVSDYLKITPKDFDVSIDYSEITMDQIQNHPKLRVHINKIPQQISSFDYFPKYVDYLIIK